MKKGPAYEAILQGIASNREEKVVERQRIGSPLAIFRIGMFLVSKTMDNPRSESSMFGSTPESVSAVFRGAIRPIQRDWTWRLAARVFQCSNTSFAFDVVYSRLNQSLDAGAISSRVWQKLVACPI